MKYSSYRGEETESLYLGIVTVADEDLRGVGHAPDSAG